MRNIKYRSKSELKFSNEKWIGEIPNEWKTYRAKYLWRKEGRIPQTGDGVVTAFRDGQVTLRENRRSDGFTFADKEIGYQRVVEGDLVISAMDAFAGAMGISDSTGKCSPVYSVCSPLMDLDRKYYGFLIREMANTKYIQSLAKGIRERSTDFRYGEFAATLLIYPKVSEQHRIAAFLDLKTAQFELLVEKKESLIEKLEEAKKSLISEVVTGKVKIVDGMMIPRDPAEMVDSGVEWLGMVPADWERLHLRFFAKDISNGTTANQIDAGRIRVTRIETISQGSVNTEKTGIINPFRGMERFRLNKGDILFSHINSLKMVGNIALYDSEEPLYNGMNLLRISIAGNPKWCYLFMKSSYFRNSCEMIAKPAINQASISIGNLKQLNMLKPPEDEQILIIDFVENKMRAFEKIINQQKQMINKLKSAKQSLISEAVTGKIDLRDWDLNDESCREEETA